MILLVFESTHDALASEQVLEDNEYKLRILPTPRVFSSSCGLSIRVNSENGDQLIKLLKNNNINNCKYAVCQQQNNNIVYSELQS